MLNRDRYGDKRPHELDRVENTYYTCQRCRLKWAQKPQGYCIGVPVYKYGSWPENLYTYTQLRRDLKMRPIDRNQPDGCYFLMKDPYWRRLYSIDRSVPRRRMVSEKQQEAVKKMRAGLVRKYTCPRCQYYDRTHGKGKYAREIQRGLCSKCWDDYDSHGLKIEQRVWARTYREKEPFVVLDSETTGIEPDQDEIIELAIVDGHSGAMLFNSLIQPEDINRYYIATHIHGITHEMLQNAPRFPDVWPAIQAILLQYPRVLVYNADFDFGMLSATAARYGYQLPDKEYERWECLMYQYARYNGYWDNHHVGYGWCKLDDACRTMNVTYDGASHRALADTIRALGVLNTMADQEPVWEGVLPLPKPAPEAVEYGDDFPF